MKANDSSKEDGGGSVKRWIIPVLLGVLWVPVWAILFGLYIRYKDHVTGRHPMSVMPALTPAEDAIAILLLIGGLIVVVRWARGRKRATGTANTPQLGPSEPIAEIDDLLHMEEEALDESNTEVQGTREELDSVEEEAVADDPRALALGPCAHAA